MFVYDHSFEADFSMSTTAFLKKNYSNVKFRAELLSQIVFTFHDDNVLDELDCLHL